MRDATCYVSLLDATGSTQAQSAATSNLPSILQQHLQTHQVPRVCCCPDSMQGRGQMAIRRAGVPFFAGRTAGSTPLADSTGSAANAWNHKHQMPHLQTPQAIIRGG